MKLAKEKNVKIYIPSGAIAGIDALKAASLSDIKQVILTTSKPLRAWNNIPYLKEKKIVYTPLNAFKPLWTEAGYQNNT